MTDTANNAAHGPAPQQAGRARPVAGGDHEVCYG